jgi:NAD/NADP transhydrogenase alpha subunit
MVTADMVEGMSPGSVIVDMALKPAVTLRLCAR